MNVLAIEFRKFSIGADWSPYPDPAGEYNAVGSALAEKATRVPSASRFFEKQAGAQTAPARFGHTRHAIVKLTPLIPEL
jgi:hypothetical protein